MKDRLIIKRGYWHYQRRVPKIYSEFDNRGIVLLSTGVKVENDPYGREAALISSNLDASTFELWVNMSKGNDPDDRKRYEAAIWRARMLGFEYKISDDLASTIDFPDLVTRLAKIRSYGIKKSAKQSVASSLLGKETEPALCLSNLLSLYKNIMAADLAAMSKDQNRKIHNARARALSVAVAIIGDKPLNEMTRADALAVRETYVDRALAGEIKRATGNKGLTLIRSMWNQVENVQQLGLLPIWSGLVVGKDDTGQRDPVPDYATRILLTPGTLEKILNPEARAILWIMIETGARPSEIAALQSDTILLGDVDIPHIDIKEGIRILKVKNCARKIPLVGCALAAAHKYPNGFPRYFDKSSTWSALVNKQLKTVPGWPQDIKPYGFRHAIKDRLRFKEAPEGLMDEIMGHKQQGPSYGAGFRMEQHLHFLQEIAWNVPEGWTP